MRTVRTIRGAAWLVALSALLASSATAQIVPRTFYVRSGGSDANCSGLLDIADPGSGPTPRQCAFSSPEGCEDRMSGGDTCLVHAGTYTGSCESGAPHPAAFDFAGKSGSAASPTVIKGFPGDAKPILCSRAGCAANPDCPTIGVVSSGTSYLTIEGFDVRGSLWIFGGTSNSHHLRVTNNVFSGGSECEGNYSLMRLEKLNGAQIDHNLFHNSVANDCGVTHNSAIKLYNAYNSVIEYNTFNWTDAPGTRLVIDDKDCTVGNIYRYNFFNGGGFRFNTQLQCWGSPQTGNVQFYGNVVKDPTGHSLGLYGPSPTGVSTNWNYHHNTFDGVTLEVLPAGAWLRQVIFRDNIVMNAGVIARSPTFSHRNDAPAWDFNYNRYDADETFYEDGATWSTLAAWQAAIGGNRESNSQEFATPCSFTNIAANIYTLLDNTNTCRTGSSSGGEIGAYGVTSCVGHLCGGGSVPAVCGNGIAEPGEICDGIDLFGQTCQGQGFLGGLLACAANCLGWNTQGCTSATCGNGIREGTETCDGADLGGQTCASQGFTAGNLSCASNCASFVTSACTGPTSSDECTQPAPGWLFCDGFESGTLAAWQADLNNDSGRLTVAAPGVQSSYAAVQHHVAGGTGGYGAKFFGDHPQLPSPGAVVSDFYLRTSVKFSSNYQWPTGTNKMFILAAFESWGAGYPGPNSWSPYYVIIELTADGRPVYTLRRKVNGDVWRSMQQNQGSSVQLVPGAWTELQFHLRLNTPGAANGVAEMWIDGVKKLEYTDVDFRGSYTQRGWNHLILSPYAGPASLANQDQFWDRIVASQSFIGTSTPGSNPPPPANLHRTDITP